MPVTSTHKKIAMIPNVLRDRKDSFLVQKTNLVSHPSTLMSVKDLYDSVRYFKLELRGRKQPKLSQHVTYS